MTPIRGILLDIDGVLHVGGNPVRGASGTLDTLHIRRIPFRCLSNTTRKCRAAIAATLRDMGLSVPERHIVTPAAAAAALLAERGQKRCLLLTTGDVFRDFLAEGIIDTRDNPDAVVIGDAGDAFTYASMNRAFRTVLDGAAFIALEKDRYWMDSDGLSLSAGPFVRGIEYATGCQAELVGKPSPAFFARALDTLGTAPEETLMVGDDVVTDIGGAHRAGMRAFLVRTGKFREDQAVTAVPAPDRIIESIAALPDFL
jgi:HAD superfamily hydrolase (TIGR01458 family)